MKVGALTSKPYSFSARPWELKSIMSLDFFDFSLAPIVFSIRGLDVLRVLPVHSKQEFNWITDKVRFFYDGLKYQRQIGFNFLGTSLSHQLSQFLASILNLWSYYPYDRRYHQATYINFGEDYPIGKDVIPGYPGMANKSRFDFSYKTPLSFRDLSHLFSLYWFWHPWLPKKGNFDFRSLYFSSLNFSLRSVFFFFSDIRNQFPSLYLKVKGFSHKFMINSSSLEEGFSNLGFRNTIYKLLNFKHPIYSYLFDYNPSAFYYFSSLPSASFGELHAYSLNYVFVPKYISDLTAYEFFGSTFSSNLTNKPVDSVFRFSDTFFSYKYSLGEYNITALLSSHFSSKIDSRVLLISIYSIFESGGSFFSFEGNKQNADSLDLFLLQDKTKLFRFDDFFNFINTLFYLLVREYEDTFIVSSGASLIGEEYCSDLRFLNRRIPLWGPININRKLSKTPRFFFKYQYTVSLLQKCNFFVKSPIFYFSKAHTRPLYDNFFLTDSLLMASPTLALAYKRFLPVSSY